MYALVIDGEFEGFVSADVVRRAIHGVHLVEVAVFDTQRGWVPVCLEKFHLALVA